LITVFYPRQLFPDKLEYDISKLLFERGYFPHNLVFEPFVNVSIDFGIWGIGFYAVILVLIMSLFVEVIKKSSGRLSQFITSFYIISIVFSFGFFQTVSSMQSSIAFLALAVVSVVGNYVAKASFRF
jgi:hypothetical protein